MRKDLLSSAIAVVVLTLLFGIVYPLLVTGISQVAFPGKADGSRVERDGKVVGSRLIGQDFRRPVVAPDAKPKLDEEGKPVLEPDPRYFQSRPSQSGYAADATFFSNLGPNSQDLHDQIVANRDAYMDLEGRYNRALRPSGVPNDAVQTSASGVDPHISVRNARIQAARVAAVRRVPRVRLLALIDDNTDDRALGLLGERGVNVLELNLALDEKSR